MTKPKSRYFGEQIDGIVHEVSRLAIACDIDFFADDAATRVLDNDETVCRKKNTAAFQKIRRHLMAYYPLEEKAIERIGADRTLEINQQVREALRRLRNEGKAGSSPGSDGEDH
jgi:hypothetical protein